MRNLTKMAMDAVAAKVRGRLVRRLLRLAMLSGVVVGAYAGAQVVARGLARGDEDADDFNLLTVMTGKDLAIGAAPFGSGRVMTLLGQTRIDLRDTTLSPSGAHLDLVTTLARVQVIVPPDWAVEVEQASLGLGSELSVDLDDPARLPEDAPKLSILADTRWGCGSVEVNAAADPS